MVLLLSVPVAGVNAALAPRIHAAIVSLQINNQPRYLSFVSGAKDDLLNPSEYPPIQMRPIAHWYGITFGSRTSATLACAPSGVSCLIRSTTAGPKDNPMRGNLRAKYLADGFLASFHAAINHSSKLPPFVLSESAKSEKISCAFFGECRHFRTQKIFLQVMKGPSCVG